MTEDRRARWRTRVGAAMLSGISLLAVLAPMLAPNDPNTQFLNMAYAPPMRVHVMDATGLRGPCVYQQVLEDRIARRYRDAESATLRWFSDGRLVTLDATAGPLLLLGGDALGRDLFSRLAYGARLSFALAALAVA